MPSKMVAETASIIDGGRPNNTNMLIAHNALINKLVTRLYFILTITWSLAYVVCKHRTDNRTSSTCFAGHFDGHDNAPVRCQAHQPMQHVQGYLRSHWKPPSGDYLSRIAPAVTMVIDFLP
jgi:hypothetical protein